MRVQKRLLELALKGLEAERQRIDEEIADIQKQIRGGGERSPNQARPQSQANPRPHSIARPAQTGSQQTDTRRKENIVGPDEEKVGGEEESDDTEVKLRDQVGGQSYWQQDTTSRFPA
jgi:hypothetical protein